MDIYGFELIIFDLDGVIVDTAKYHYLAWKELADKLGFSLTLEHNERLKGISRTRSLEIILEIGGLADAFTPEQKEEMATAKNTRYMEYIHNLKEDELLPGTKEFLTELKSRGIKTAIGSASKNALPILDKLDVIHFFDVIIDGNATDKAKPHPEVFLLAAEKLGIPPENCAVFEDAQAGIEAALAAGMTAIAVGSPENLKGASMYVAGLDHFQRVSWNMP
ncbi:MAG: beta-phosphoglucomutase [Defluviitaleaceae bacterium]|nr:beta-phosphoglucomutase [Defluviitaleaceae bacterium]